eukprot:TRINITY_DN29739_c0_g1_i1.p1 TRINITY_DN29739_c0_g1~~TRINITY_DN29739_c0_g1_i1.p1  ORF type:complete len:100 (+),score=22.69 TRINITY_DN29739_c0_g1_i1:209-508(+)
MKLTSVALIVAAVLLAALPADAVEMPEPTVTKRFTSTRPVKRNRKPQYDVNLFYNCTKNGRGGASDAPHTPDSDASAWKSSALAWVSSFFPAIASQDTR